MAAAERAQAALEAAGGWEIVTPAQLSIVTFARAGGDALNAALVERAGDNGASTYLPRLLQRGYAVLGVSVRGTGCSEGVFDPFALTMGRDGADAVEWAARQPWSDGRVGMFGVSFGGITQLLTAADRPPHLRAIAPDSATSDLYRDVVYPGGILEHDVTFAWTGIQKEGGTEYALTGAPRDGDTQCDQNYVSHEVANASPDYFI